VYIPIWALVIVLALCTWAIATRASRNYAESIDVALSKAVRDLVGKTDDLKKDLNDEIRDLHTKIDQLQSETEITADNLETDATIKNLATQFGERIQELEQLACLGKARCKKCGFVFTVLPSVKYLHCRNCRERFGDVHELLLSPIDEMPENLEWIHKDGFERTLLLSYLRSDIKSKYPRVLMNIPISDILE
jgi:hypothetical protein